MAVNPPTWLDRFADALVRRRNLLLIGAIAAAALSAYPASRLSFEQSIESLYSDSDPHLQDYLKSKSHFGGDEFVIVAYREPQLQNRDGLDHVRSLAQRLGRIAGVQEASTQDVARMRDSMNGLAAEMLPGGLKILAPGLASLRRGEMEELSRGVLIGSDDETTAVVLRLIPESVAPIPRGETIAAIRDAAASGVRELTGDPNARAYVVGEPVQVHDMFRIVEADGRKLFYWSLALLGAVIIVLFRSVRWMVLPLSVVVVAIVLTEAVLVISRMQLSMVSSMLNSLVTIIGIATVMHVTLHYRDLRHGLDRVAALRQTVVDLAPAIFWTGATTAVGFGALLSSSITPVYSFGTMMALGSMMVLVAAATVLPGGILVGPVQRDPGTAPAERQLSGLLARANEWVNRRPKAFGAAFACIMIFTAFGFTRLKVETDFSRNFRESSEIVESLNFVETNLGGAGTWEVNFPAPAELDPEFLVQVRSLAQRLRELEADGKPRLTKVVAITDILDLIPGSADSSERIRAKLDLIARFQPEYEPGLYDAEHGRMRLVLRALERQPSEAKLALIDQVHESAANEFGSARTTGMFVLLAYLIESLLRDQLTSFAIAGVGICAMMTAAFGSWRIGIISLLPNVFPNLLLIGGLGWMGVPVNIGTAMIASVSMGLTVDSSIHYIAGYRRARRRASADEAFRQTNQGVGRALVFATFALVVGFSVLTLSEFIPLVYFGVLVSLAMLGGLFGNLTLLPLLLRWAERDPVGASDQAERVEAGRVAERSGE